MLRPLAILLLLVATGAQAATKTSTADCNWAVVTDCFGGGGGVTDHFVVAAGHTITVTGDPGLTTGDITVQGTLIVPAGITLHYGSGTADGVKNGLGLMILDGGALRQEGSLLKTCRITEAMDSEWDTGVAATHVVSASVDCDLTGVSAATDYVFFGDDDPADLEAVLTGGGVQVGPGPPVAGLYRPSFNKWASYKITAAAAGVVTWDLDPAIGTYTGTPYAGSRYVPVAGTAGGDTLTYTPRWLKRSTSVGVPNAYSTGVCAITADRGSWYLQYDEGAGTCSGKMAKILSCTSGNPDVLEVQGDVSGCTDAASAARITTGARRGDKLFIYRPATLNGNIDGDAVGEGAVANEGGSWYAHWARMEYQWGYQTNGGYAPNGSSAGSNIFIQGTATSQPSADWNWVDVAYGAFTDDVDVGALYIDSDTACCAPAGAGVNMRWPNNGLIDFTTSTFRHVHIHDALMNTVGGAIGGSHGLFVDGAKNTDFAQFRIERQNDDGVVFQMLKGNGTSADWSDVLIRQFLVYENIADLLANATQEGFEFAIENEGVGALNTAFNTPIRIQDVLTMGAQQAGFLIPYGKGIYKGITNGGGALAGSYSNFSLKYDGTGDMTVDDAVDGAAIVYGNKVYDSNIYMLGATTSTTPTSVLGEMHSSFVSGYDASGATTKSHGFTGVVDRSVIDLGNSVAAGNYIINSSAAAGTSYLTRRAQFTNSVLRSTAAGSARMFNDTATAAVDVFNNTITRTVLLLGAPDTNSGVGVLVNFANAAALTNATTTINGLFITSNAATGNGLIAVGNGSNVVTVNTSCFETAHATPFAGAAANGTTTIKQSPLAPASSDTTVVLRDFLNTNLAAETCAAANYPTALGYSQFRIGHAQLGDFEIAGFAHSSSTDLISMTPVLTGGGSGGHWPAKAWPE